MICFCMTRLLSISANLTLCDCWAAVMKGKRNPTSLRKEKAILHQLTHPCKVFNTSLFKDGKDIRFREVQRFRIFNVFSSFMGWPLIFIWVYADSGNCPVSGFLSLSGSVCDKWEVLFYVESTDQCSCDKMSDERCFLCHFLVSPWCRVKKQIVVPCKRNFCWKLQMPEKVVTWWNDSEGGEEKSHSSFYYNSNLHLSFVL